MGQFYDEIPDDPALIEWIRAQQIFHVASAPLKGGRVNVSPKGLPNTFKLVSKKAVWYLDLTGSGNETMSHLYEPGNGRMTILFEAFEGPPKIVRLFGRGRVIERGTPEFDQLMNEGPGGTVYDWPTPEMQPGARAIIWLDIEKVGTSCGWAIPFMKFENHRYVLNKWAETLEKNDEETEDPFSLPSKKGLKSYWRHFNTWSVDGLPGIRQVSHMADKSLVHKVMTDVGLKPASSSTKGTTETWIVLLVGIVLGFFLSSVVNGGMSSVAAKLVKT